MTAAHKKFSDTFEKVAVLPQPRRTHRPPDLGPCYWLCHDCNGTGERHGGKDKCLRCDGKGEVLE